MAAAQFLKTRISPATKKLVQAVASQQLLTESIWLRRVIDAALGAPEGNAREVLEPVIPRGLGARLSVRLRTEDRLLLHERAAARRMPAATYVSVLVRAHLRNLPPLPKDELLTLKRSVAELGAIGRNLNQLARAANQGNRVSGPSPNDLRTLLKVCEALRDHVKSLIKANASSWEAGHATGD